MTNGLLKRGIPAAVLALATGFSGFGIADDTEIFNASPSLAAATSAPNVLIILDNTSNWGNGATPQPFTDEKAALTTVANALGTFGYKVNLGLMFQTAGDTDGGYMRFAIRPMTDSTTGIATPANTALKALIAALHPGDDKANNPTYAQTMADAFYYFKGMTPRAGFGDVHRDCGSENTNIPYAAALTAYPYAYKKASDSACGTASPTNKNEFTNPATSAGVTYRSPMSTTDSCQQNYIIYISNGPISNNDGQVEQGNNNPGYALLRDAVGANTGQLATIPASPDGETRVNYADEWARFLYQTDLNTSLDGTQNVITYTINVRPGTTGQGPAHVAMMNSMANNGGGRPFTAGTEADIVEALLAIFNEIQAVNSVFASASLPVSVNVRGINANQVYIGQFRPDKDSLPRWPGNLKMYQLGVNTSDNLVLTDARATDLTNATSIVASGTGQIIDEAVSFWTQSSSFWGFNSSVGPVSSATPASDRPDGPVVEKGGVAQALRTDYATSQTARKVFTCLGCVGTETALSTTGTTAATTNFSSTNTSMTTTAIRTTFFGVTPATDTDLTNLIDWVRGKDNALSPGGENNNNDMTDIRASIHGDVLHSRPIVINYGGDSADNDVAIFYGSNDGLLRAVKGGFTTTTGTAATSGVAPGDEMWAFVAEEFFPKFLRQRDNFPAVTSASGLTTVTASGVRTAASANVTGLTAAQTATLARGMSVSGTGIPVETYVVGVATTSVTLSKPATAGGTSALTFTPNPKDYFFDGPMGVYFRDVSSASAAPDGKIDGTCYVPTTGPTVCDQVMLFVPMRRGGRMIYAFDVTNPKVPKFKWKAGCPNLSNNTGCTNAAFNEIGQTWSEPKVVRVRLGSVDKDVIVMGAGYDPAIEDQDPIMTGSRTMGRGIYVIDIADGSVIWRAGPAGALPSDSAAYSYSTSLASVPGMDYAIPSDVTVIDRDGNGYVDRAYVGDTGGNVWRVDMSATDSANWRVNKLASVGRAAFGATPAKLVAPTSGADNDIEGHTRKFLYPPDVVPATGYDAVLIGSGDREHPFNGFGRPSGGYQDPTHPPELAVHNRYYMFKDKDISTTYSCNGRPDGSFSGATSFKCVDPSSTSTPVDAVLYETLLFNSTNVTGTAIPDDPGTLENEAKTAEQVRVELAMAGISAKNGWYIDFQLGEKSTGGSVTFSGATFFNTNVPTPPAAGVCTSNLGEARQYAVNFLTGGAAYDRGTNGVEFVGDRYSSRASGGFLPSPVGLVVKVGDKLYQGVASGPNITTPGGIKIGDRIKSYWRKRID